MSEDTPPYDGQHVSMTVTEWQDFRQPVICLPSEVDGRPHFGLYFEREDGSLKGTLLDLDDARRVYRDLGKWLKRAKAGAL